MYIKSVDEIIIGYVINEDFKILLCLKMAIKKTTSYIIIMVFILREL